MKSTYKCKNSPEEILHMTENRATVDDVKRLGNIHIIFPEFLKKWETIVMLPGYMKISDAGRCDSEVVSYKQQNVSEMIDKIPLIKKIFGVDEVSIEFVTVVEVW